MRLRLRVESVLLDGALVEEEGLQRDGKSTENVMMESREEDMIKERYNP